MSQQTESYIVLKPIAERFSQAANKISDDEIKAIIKDEMREQIRKAIDFSSVTEIVEEYICDHEMQIADATADAIIRRLELPSDYKF